MQNLANLVIDLLSAITFQPADGTDPDDLATLEQTAWQTLIHGLSPDELTAVQSSVKSAVAVLSQEAVDSLPEHLQVKLSVLQQFLDGELE